MQNFIWVDEVFAEKLKREINEFYIQHQKHPIDFEM